MADCDKQSTFDVSQLRSRFSLLETQVNGHPLRYLDNASTTPMPEPVLSTLLAFERYSRANVSRAGHSLATRATDAFEQARHSVARYLNIANVNEVIFTSGTTASINMLAHCLEPQLKPGDEVVISQAEHHSNYIPWQMLRDRCGVLLKVIPVGGDGRLCLDALDQLIGEKCQLIAVTHVSNVTGAISDVQAILKAARKVGAQVLLDGAQAVAHGPVDIPALGVDYYAFSGHKCFGPTGVGVLWGREALLNELPPFMGGGAMVQRVGLDQNDYAGGNKRFEAGTPPIAQAVALGAALEWLMALPWPELQAHQHSLSEYILEQLKTIPGLHLIGPATAKDRLPVFSFDIENMHPHDICHILDQRGLALRGGHHCAQPLMNAFDLTACSRASLSLFNNKADIDALTQGLHEARDILL